MFVVSEAEAAAIRAVYRRRGDGRGRAAPAVPGHYRRCTGAGVRPDHRFGLALLANAIATGGALVALILAFGPRSGAL